MAGSVMTAPTVLLLDEPLAGVGHQDLPDAIARLARLAAGRTVLLIEHNMGAVMQLAQQALVMVNGRLVASGPPDEMRRDRAVRVAYLGAEA